VADVEVFGVVEAVWSTLILVFLTSTFPYSAKSNVHIMRKPFRMLSPH
jgi:hypothetical protein